MFLLPKDLRKMILPIFLNLPRIVKESISKLKDIEKYQETIVKEGNIIIFIYFRVDLSPIETPCPETTINT